VETLELVNPTPELAEAYLQMCREEIAHDGRLSGILPTTLDELVPAFERWREQERIGDESTGGVPQSTYWLLRDRSELLGSSLLRHRLAPSQEQTVGHVDYGIRPSARRKGYGIRLLELTLARARLLGLREVFVMCRKANAASVRVIERNGGVLLGEYPRASDGELMLRYSIGL
jgi:predicted acetyltransferase